MAEVLLVVVVLSRLLLELALRLLITEVGPGALRQLLFAFADDLLFAGHLRDRAEEHRTEDEDRPEEDEAAGEETRRSPDEEHETGRTGHETDEGAFDAVAVELLRGFLDLLGRDRNPIIAELSQRASPARLVEVVGIDGFGLGDDEIVDERRDLSERLHPRRRLGALIELLGIDLSEGIRLGEHVGDHGSIGIGGSDLPVIARVGAEAGPEWTTFHLSTVTPLPRPQSWDVAANAARESRPPQPLSGRGDSSPGTATHGAGAPSERG